MGKSPPAGSRDQAPPECAPSPPPKARSKIDQTPDISTDPGYEGDGGLGPRRPIQVQIDDGELAGQGVAVLRGDLKPVL